MLKETKYTIAMIVSGTIGILVMLIYCLIVGDWNSINLNYIGPIVVIFVVYFGCGMLHSKLKRLNKQEKEVKNE